MFSLKDLTFSTFPDVSTVLLYGFVLCSLSLHKNVIQNYDAISRIKVEYEDSVYELARFINFLLISYLSEGENLPQNTYPALV